MTFDIQPIVRNKQARRTYLSRLPVAEKLAMLDALRERTLAIRAAARSRSVGVKDKTALSEPGEASNA